MNDPEHGYVEAFSSRCLGQYGV